MVWRCINFRMVDDERVVFALLQHDHADYHLVARLFLDRENGTGLSYQLLDYFDQLGAGSREGRAFPGTDTLRAEIGSLATKVWETLGANEIEIGSSAVLNLYDRHGSTCGSLESDEDGFQNFVSQLKSFSGILHRRDNEQPNLGSITVLGQASVRFQSSLASRRNCCLISALQSAPRQNFVFKGITFADYMAFGADVFKSRKDSLYREIHLLCNVIPPHPNVMPYPRRFVTIPNSEDPESPKVLGVLYPYYRNSTMASAIARSVEENSRIYLRRKAKWCFQLTNALWHIHYQGHAWHQDPKPPNILLDDDDNVVIIDWEQGNGGTNKFVSAPETDGSFDLKVATSEGERSRSLLQYIPYNGPERVNNVVGTPRWDVFPQWHRISRQAVEAANVFSLGSTIFLLLEEITTGKNPGLKDYYEASRDWSNKSSDIPQAWKENVGACTHDDPNKRPTLLEEIAFWEQELKALETRYG